MSNKNFTPAQKIAKESTISFVGMGYGQFLRYLFTAILARLVGTHYLGIYSIGNSVTNIAGVIGRAGTDIGIMRQVSARNLDQDIDAVRLDIRSSLKIGLIFSLIIMSVQIALSGWLVQNIFHESELLQIVLIVFALSIPFFALMMIATGATQGFQILKYTIFVESIINPTILFVSLIFIYFTFSSELAIILPTLITGIIGFIVANIFLKRVTGVNILNVRKTIINKNIISFSMPIMFSVILASLLHWMDILMLGYFTNAETVGLYHPAVRTAGLQQSILIAFVGIFAPMFSKYFTQNNVTEMNHIYQLVTRWIITLIIPILIIIILFSTKIMLLFGTNFIQAANGLIILGIGTSVFAAFGLAGRALIMSGHQVLNLYNTLVVLIVNIVLNSILIPSYGIVGAAIATLISILLLTLARIIETRIYLRINPFNMKTIKPILAGFITIVIIYFIKPYLMEYHTLLTLFFGVTLTLTVYFSIILLAKLDEDDKDFLRSIIFLKNRIINKK